MEELKRYTRYQEFKQALDAEMLRTAEGFVRIGYLLSYANETNIIAEAGYDNVNDFAKAEYGIDNTQVSRFIHIYERFGVPGEARLQEHYINHGVAKLGIMLTLPDYINEDISAGYSKTEINTIKKEFEEERKISDIEVMLEEKDEVQQSLPEGLKQAVYQLVHDYPEEYEKMYKAIALDDLKGIFAPNGEETYIIRIPGTGKMIIFFKANENIIITNVRSGDKDSFEWQQLFNALKEYFSMGSSAKESWENVFKEEFPKEEKPENTDNNKVEPEKSKKETRKESKVKVPKKPEAKPEPKPEPTPESAPEEQIPGQDNIMNHPEYLPDEEKLTGEVEDLPEESEEELKEESVNSDNYKVTPAGLEEIAPVQSKTNIDECVEEIRACMKRMDEHLENGDWAKVNAEATAIVWTLKKIKSFERVNKKQEK